MSASGYTCVGAGIRHSDIEDISIIDMLSIMKLICILLSTNVMILSTVPCCSDDNCIDEVETTNIDGHRQDHDEDERKSCSQFLTCGTCSGFMFLNFDPFRVYLAIETLIVYYTSPLINDYGVKIWQPPNLS